jgi:DNA-binding transcriptional MerR regulator
MANLRIHGPNDPVYTIGVVARLLGISPQTLRLFEREGLLEPSRTENNMRLYSQNELQLLHRICVLFKEDGLNIAGVRTVLLVERRYEAIIQTLTLEDGQPAEAAGEAGGAGRAGRAHEDAREASLAPAGENQTRQARPGGRATVPDEGTPRRGDGRRGGSLLDEGGWPGAGAMLALLLYITRTVT